MEKIENKIDALLVEDKAKVKSQLLRIRGGGSCLDPNDCHDCQLNVLDKGCSVLIVGADTILESCFPFDIIPDHGAGSKTGSFPATLKGYRILGDDEERLEYDLGALDGDVSWSPSDLFEATTATVAYIRKLSHEVYGLTEGCEAIPVYPQAGTNFGTVWQVGDGVPLDFIPRMVGWTGRYGYKEEEVVMWVNIPRSRGEAPDYVEMKIVE